MTDTDFDFDFQVGPGQEGSGSGSGQGSREREASNGSSGPAETEKGDGDGASRGSHASNGSSRRGDRAGGNGSNGARRAPLVYRDAEPAERPGNGKPSEKPGAEDEDEDAERDWLTLADDNLADAPLDEIAAPDPGPAGPRRPREGRNLARDASKRASRRGGADFEEILERQPQKSAAAKKGSAVVYGLRGLLDDGRERLKGGREKLGAISELRERIPSSIPRPAPADGGGADGNGGAGGGGRPPIRLPKRLTPRGPRNRKPGQIKKLRLAVIVIGLGALAMVSMVFGMMMAVAGDLPALENEAQYKASQNSEVFDSEGRKIGTLLSNTQRRLIESEDISPYMKQAIVAIEDERFYEHRGVDFMGIARAVGADLMPGGSTQGASTITMQFVKNALEAQNSRTYFQKLREAALAYHLERQWDKDKILTQYLNSIYFGEGAYGIEMAARTYFGKQHPECLVDGAEPCASVLAPEEAALLAGIVNQPGAASPRANPQGALDRRNLVLTKMTEQGFISDEEYETAAAVSPPAASDIEKPEEDSLSPYFTSWLRQQIVDRYGAGKAFSGGLDVHTTLDLDMQETAESIAYDSLAGIEPTASVVVLDNATGAVKAMVGGNDYSKEPFNLATNGQRQPGSAFKPFVLSAYLKYGGSLGDTFTSGPKEWIVPNSGGKEGFPVENYEDNYLGSADVATATKYSDNSVFTEMGLGPPPGSGQGVLGGIERGPKRIAQLAEEMGIRTSVDRIPAITLGAPSIGFTPLEMTYAFNTIAHDGQRVGGSLDSIPGNKSLDDLGPTAIEKIVAPNGDTEDKNEVKEQTVLSSSVADSVKSALHGPVSSGGTGEEAQTPGDEWGKTGTTENHGDAWFCGGTDHLTACVWVGHAMNNTPMETEYAGSPVAGGTYPAQIWGSIMTALEDIYAARQAEREAEDDEEDDGDDDGSSSDSSSPAPYTPPSSGSSGGGSSGGGGASQPPAPSAPAPSGGGGAPTGGTGGTGL